jgi:hypothetical protein
VFCEGVRHHLRFCLDHLSCVKTADFQSWKQRAVEGAKSGEQGGLGMRVMLFLVKNVLVTGRWCCTLMIR